MEITAPNLVKKWRKLVSDNVMIGRDAHAMKELLEYLTPAQILLGMYLMAGKETLTIPAFVRQKRRWLVEDEDWAEVELARHIAKTEPQEYWIYRDLEDEQTTSAHQAAKEAKVKLTEWSQRVLETYR